MSCIILLAICLKFSYSSKIYLEVIQFSSSYSCLTVLHTVTQATYKLCSFGRLISPSRPQSLQKPKDSHDTRQCAVVQLLGHVQLFCDPKNCSPPGSSVHGILQARILEWVAVCSSRGSSWPRDQILFCLLHWQAGSLPLAPPGKPLYPV